MRSTLGSAYLNSLLQNLFIPPEKRIQCGRDDVALGALQKPTLGVHLGASLQSLSKSEAQAQRCRAGTGFVIVMIVSYINPSHIYAIPILFFTLSKPTVINNDINVIINLNPITSGY